MKKLLLIPVICLLFGCAALTRTDIQDRWGPPAKCEQQNELTTCYWYIYLGDGPAPKEIGPDWKCREVTFDKNNKVVKVRRYWIQPERTR